MKLLRQVDLEKWREFVYRHPRGNIFQTPEMYEVYKNTKNYTPIFLAAADERDKILGILVAVIQQEGRGIVGLLSARSVMLGGPLIEDDNTEVLKAIIGGYNEILKNSVLYSQIRNLRDPEFGKKIFADLGYVYEEHLDIHIDLNKDKDTLWQEVHSKKRNEIRKATKEGTSVLEVSDGVEAIYAIFEEVYRKARLPLADISLFKSAANILGPKNMIKFFVALNDGKIIGAMCVLVYKNIIYDWYAGSCKGFLNKYPNDLIPWEVFMWGKKNGFTDFDWGGAGSPDKEYGVRYYKKQFGGTMVNYGRFQKVYRPIEFKLANLGLKIWQKVV